MYFWDKKWSLYPMYARPGIKPATARGICNEQKQCQGFTADFCVYVDGGAPSGGTYESVADVIIFSAFKNGSGVKILSEFKTTFTWKID